MKVNEFEGLSSLPKNIQIELEKSLAASNSKEFLMEQAAKLARGFNTTNHDDEENNNNHDDVEDDDDNGDDREEDKAESSRPAAKRFKL